MDPARSPPTSTDEGGARAARRLALALLLAAGLDILCTLLVMAGLACGPGVAVTTCLCKLLCMILVSLYVNNQRREILESGKRLLLGLAHCQVYLTLGEDHLPAWRRGLARRLEDPLWAYIVIALVMVDMLCTLVQEVASTSLLNPAYAEVIDAAAMLCKGLGSCILCAFMVEQLLQLVAFGRVLFTKPWFVLDLVVVGISFISELCERVLGVGFGRYHICLRLWKVVALVLDSFVGRSPVVTEGREATAWSKQDEAATPRGISFEAVTPPGMSFEAVTPRGAPAEGVAFDDVAWAKLLAKTLVRHGIPLPAAPPAKPLASRPPSRPPSRSHSPSGTRRAARDDPGRTAADEVSDPGLSAKWPLEHEADVFEEAVTTPTKARFFRHLYLAQDGGLQDIDFLFGAHRLPIAALAVVCLVVNVAALLRNGLRTIAHLPFPLDPEGGRAWLQPPTLVALFELSYLAFFLCRALRDVVELCRLGGATLQGEQRYRRWRAVGSLLVHMAPQLRTFSALRVLYFVLPAVLLPDLQAVLRGVQSREGEQGGEEGVRRSHPMAAFVGFRLLVLCFGAQAFLVRLCAARAALRTFDEDDSQGAFFWAALELVAFANQMTGVVDLGLFSRRRLFLFIFGGVDVILEEAERKRKRAWLAALLQRAWGHRRSSALRFVAAALTFSDADLQRLVMHERTCGASAPAGPGDAAATATTAERGRRRCGAGGGGHVSAQARTLAGDVHL